MPSPTLAKPSPWQGLISWWGVLFLLTTPTWASGEPTPLFSLAAGNTFELHADGAWAEVLIPLLTEAPLEAGHGLQAPQVYDVALGQRHDGAFRQALSVSWVPEGEPRPSGLKVRVDLGKLTEAGTYEVVVAVRAALREKPELLSFQLIHPSASLASVPPLRLEKVVFPLSGAHAPALVLRETTRRSHLTDMTIEDPEGAGPVAVNTLEPLAVKAGGVRRVALEVPEDREVGTYPGRLLIRAPQLADPVEISYELVIRHSRWMILVTLAVGLLCGQLVRVVLAERIEKNTARAESLRQRRKLMQERERYTDITYRARLQQLARDLEEAERRSAAAINLALQQANQGLAEAQGELGARRQEAVAQANELLALVDPPWALPERMERAVKGARQALEQVKGLVEQAPGSARQLLAEARSTLRRELHAGWLEWRSALGSLERLTAPDIPLPRPIPELLEPLLSKLKEDVEGLTVSEDVALEALLKAVHLSVVHAQDVCGVLQQRLLPVARSVLGVLAMSGKDKARVAELEALTGALQERWQGSTEPRERVAGLGDEVSRLLQAMVSAILANTVDKNESLERVRQQLAEHNYEAAARQGLAHGLPLTFSAEEEEDSPDSADLINPSRGPLLQTALPMSSAEPLSAPQGPQLSLEELEVRTFAQLAAERALQSLLLGTLLVIGGFLAYSKTFTGTLTDYATLFFWAFATDVTLETIKSVAGPFKNSSSREGTP